MLLRFLLLQALFLTACSLNGPRPSYNRLTGEYSADAPSPAPPGEAVEAPARLREVAESYLGTPYRFAGKTRAGMDCSGFVGAVFAEVYGVTLPRSSREMAGMGAPVGEGDLRPGDLVFFKDFARVNHAGIFMGKGRFIHSSTSRGVEYNHLDFPYYRKRYAGARRIL